MNSSEKAQAFTLFSNSVPAEFEIGNQKLSSENHVYRGYLKRFFDLLICLFLLPFIAPVLLLLIVLIKLDSKGPAIFKSERIGFQGKRIFIFKLRTMVI